MSTRRSGTRTAELRLTELLEQIHVQEMVLPEFQRDFDWGDERVIQLLATVARRWPAGSLLLQEFKGKTFYRLREFDGGPSVDESRVRYVVLDGQQRLTALYHAIFDAGPYVFAIRAGALTVDATVDQLEDGIRSFERPAWDSGYRDRPVSVENDWIPFYALRSAADYFGWRDRALRTADPESREIVADLLTDAYRHGLDSFHSYLIPAVTVTEDLESGAIARIFERVNRGGLTLGAFDLMVAKTFEPGWNLRERWDEARAERPLIEAFFGEDGMPVIQVIALKARGSVRENDVLGLEGLAVRQDWDEALMACERAAGFLQQHCGVRTREWVPYRGMIITLAAVALEHDLDEHRSALVTWYLTRAYGLVYETASNTVTVEQYHQLTRVLAGTEPMAPTAVAAAVLRQATRKRRGALWRAFMTTLTMNGALDPATGDPVEDPRGVPLLRDEPPSAPGLEPPRHLVLNTLLADRARARAVEEGGLVGLVRDLRGLPAETAERVRASQLLGPFETVPVGSESTGLLIEARLKAFERWFRDQVGYGFDYGASEDDSAQER